MEILGERLDHLAELDNRPGPAVGDHQRQRIGVGAALMNEVNVQSVDLGDELIEPVQRSLSTSPVVAVRPVICQFTGVSQRDALIPV